MKITKRGTFSCKPRCGPSDLPPEAHTQNRAVKLPLVLFYKHTFTLEIGKSKQYQIETLSLSRNQSFGFLGVKETYFLLDASFNV